MPQMFQYVVWPQPAPDTLHNVDNFTDGDFHTKREELNFNILLYAFLLFVWCDNGVQCVCSRMVAILRTDTFYDMPYIKIDYWLKFGPNQMDGQFTDIIWWITALTI